ncbi:MAG: tetratricopeptide repeat protein [Myxococcales bacterium]|nr:tetratricopeptide repeat protein [Myxococcales bacterium]
MIWLTTGCVTPEEAAPPEEAPAVVTTTTASDEARDAFATARVASDNFRTPEAIAELQRALELDPDFVLAKALLGSLTPGNEGLALLREANEAASALPDPERILIASLLAAAAGNQAQSNELLEKVATLAPDDWRVQMQLGATDFFAQDYDGALEHLTKATELAPEAGPAWNMLGYTQSLQGDVDAAVASFDKYIAAAPGEANPHDSKGEILMAAGRFPEAEAAFQEATKAVPSFFLGWYGVAQTRFLRGDWEGGMAAVEKGEKAAPRPIDKVSAHAVRAWAHAAQGDREAAEAALVSEGEQAKAQDLPTPYAFSSVTRGQVLLGLDAWTDASAAFDEALTRLDEVALQGAPADAIRAQVALGKGHAAARQGQVDAAQQALDEARDRLATQPGLENPVRHLEGIVALARGEQDAAIDALSRCAAVAFPCRADLAEVQRAAGDDTGAAATVAELRGRPARQAAYLLVWTSTKLED